MSAAELIAQARAHGVELYLRPDGEVRVRCERGRVPGDLLERLRAQRAEVVAALRESAGEHGLPRNPGADPVLEERREPVAWRLYSRALDRELWVCRDRRAAEELWAETRLPTLTLDEWPKLDGQAHEVVAAVLDVRTTFGPSAVVRAIRGGRADA